MTYSIADLTLPRNATLREVMACIDRHAKGIALILDDTQRLLGTVTDGDIRRALLGGATLETRVEPYVQRGFTKVAPTEGRAEVLDLMQARGLRHLPIVDDSGHLIGLHLLAELLGRVERPHWAVVMAGGQGTRLRPLTEHVPKPMLKVAGRPILERLLLHLVHFGFRRIFLSVNYLGHLIEEHFGDGSRLGCRVEYLREDQPLGTAGSLSLLPELPRHPMLVLNGDLVTQVDLDRFLRFHESGGFAASLGARRYFHQIPFGCLEVEAARVVGMEEKPIVQRTINAGIYLLSPDSVRAVPRAFCNMPDLVSELVSKRMKVGAFLIEEDWIDVGQHEQLRKAQQGGG